MFMRFSRNICLDVKIMSLDHVQQMSLWFCVLHHGYDMESRIFTQRCCFANVLKPHFHYLVTVCVQTFHLSQSCRVLTLRLGLLLESFGINAVKVIGHLTCCTWSHAAHVYCNVYSLSIVKSTLAYLFNYVIRQQLFNQNSN